MQIQLQHIIAGIPAEQMKFTDHTVTAEGRSKVIQIAEQVKPQGRPSATDLTNGELISLYNQFLVEKTERGIIDEIANEALQTEIARKKTEAEFAEKEAELLKKYNIVLSATEKKQTKFTKGIAWTGITLMLLTVIFAFSINFINLEEFFGEAMREKFGFFGNVMVGFVSILIAVSFAFFSTLKNRKMVSKTLWILPADLLLSFLIATDIFDGVGGYWMNVFKVIVILIYVTQMYFILINISNLFVGTGIPAGKEKEHYENVFNKIFA